jgi:hypothetical protein
MYEIMFFSSFVREWRFRLARSEFAVADFGDVGGAEQKGNHRGYGPARAVKKASLSRAVASVNVS